MFDTIAETEQKLHNTIIFYKDDPVVVGGTIGTDSNPRIMVRNFGSIDWKEIPLKDPLFNMKNLGGSLGYINYKQGSFKTAAWSRRVPIRKSHSTQGLSQHNVRIDGSDVTWKFLNTEAPSNLFHYENNGLVDTMKGLFPTLKDLKSVASGESFIETAFHKHLSIAKEFNDLWKLRYKNQEIGWTSDLDQFRIDKSWQYLGELYEENDMKVRC